MTPGLYRAQDSTGDTLDLVLHLTERSWRLTPVDGCGPHGYEPEVFHFGPGSPVDALRECISHADFELNDPTFYVHSDGRWTAVTRPGALEWLQQHRADLGLG